MAKIIGVKFSGGGKTYYFEHDGGEYAIGDTVIVDTARGVEYASVVIPCREVAEENLAAPLKPILRRADGNDLARIRANEDRKPAAMKTFEEKARKYALPMKLVDCEFTFDGTKVIFYFTADARVDFRDFVREMSSVFHLRIELRQISVRDEIKMMGGVGPCGRECCCYAGLKDPRKVSIKMAKNQGLSLNPSKTSGLCGRLMCCLSYEDRYYEEAVKQMPRMGAAVSTPSGEGTVVNMDMLRMRVKVRIEQGDSYRFEEFDADRIGRPGEAPGPAEGVSRTEDTAPGDGTEPAENVAPPKGGAGGDDGGPSGDPGPGKGRAPSKDRGHARGRTPRKDGTHGGNRPDAHRSDRK